MDVSSLDSHIDTISRRIEEKLGIKGTDLAVQLKKIGRRLPRKTRRQIALLLETRTQTQHPKLATMIDWDTVRFSAKQVLSRLDTFDLKADRRRQRIDRALGMVANVTVAVLLVIGVALLVN